MASARPVAFLAALLGPLATLLILIGNAVTPGKGYREGPFASQAELREMVDLAEADDLIEDDEAGPILEVSKEKSREVAAAYNDLQRYFVDEQAAPSVNE